MKILLGEQKKNRTPHTQGDFQLHIAALHDRRIETEARRIVENVKGLGETDSPEKTHCAVELSPYFVPLATDKDMERLLSMLPYKSLSFSTLEGKHGVYAVSYTHLSLAEELLNPQQFEMFKVYLQTPVSYTHLER